MFNDVFALVANTWYFSTFGIFGIVPFLVVSCDPYAKLIDCFFTYNNASFTVILPLIHWLDQLVSVGSDCSSAQKQDHCVLEGSIQFIESAHIHHSQSFA